MANETKVKRPVLQNSHSAKDSVSNKSPAVCKSIRSGSPAEQDDKSQKDDTSKLPSKEDDRLVEVPTENSSKSTKTSSEQSGHDFVTGNEKKERSKEAKRRVGNVVYVPPSRLRKSEDQVDADELSKDGGKGGSEDSLSTITKTASQSHNVEKVDHTAVLQRNTESEVHYSIGEQSEKSEVMEITQSSISEDKCGAKDDVFQHSSNMSEMHKTENEIVLAEHGSGITSEDVSSASKKQKVDSCQSENNQQSNVDQCDVEKTFDEVHRNSAINETQSNSELISTSTIDSIEDIFRDPIVNEIKDTIDFVHTQNSVRESEVHTNVSDSVATDSSREKCSMENVEEVPPHVKVGSMDVDQSVHKQGDSQDHKDDSSSQGELHKEKEEKEELKCEHTTEDGSEEMAMEIPVLERGISTSTLKVVIFAWG